MIAAASAQLGWPYLWGGESRADGGFDCSGLVDYALAAAGFPVGRPTAAGLQSLSVAVPLAATRPGDLVFVGAPAHHVGLVVAPGLAIEAPHRGAVVHYEPLARGGWTSAGRLAALARRPRTATRFRRGSRASCAPSCSLPVAPPISRRRCSLRSSRPRAGSTRRPSRSAGALGIAQFMPGTWAGTWNPWRARSPLDPVSGDPGAGPLPRSLVARADGDLARALAAYHDGWAGSEGGAWSPVTRAYVSTILRRFGGSDSRASGAVTADMTGPLPAAPVLRLVSLGRASPKG